MVETRFYAKTITWIVKHERGEKGGGAIYTCFASEGKLTQDRFLSLVNVDKQTFEFGHAMHIPHRDKIQIFLSVSRQP